MLGPGFVQIFSERSDIWKNISSGFFFFFLRPGLIFKDRFHNEIGKYTKQWQIILLVTVTCLQRLMVYTWIDVYPNSRPPGLAFMGQLLCAGHCPWGWGHSRDRRSQNSCPQRPLSTGACPRYIPWATEGIRSKALELSWSTVLCWS